MDEKEIIDIIQNEIRKISNSTSEFLDKSCSLKNTGKNNLGLCSLELVQLLVELEGIFHIEFDNKVETISELAEYIERNLVD